MADFMNALWANQFTGFTAMCKYLLEEIKHKQELELVAIVGKHGRGKSYSALSIGDEICKVGKLKPFKVPDNIAIGEPSKMMELTDHEWQPGTPLVFDEFGLAFPKSQWFTESNRLMNDFLDIARIKRVIFFVTLNNLGKLDSTGRLNLTHVLRCKYKGNGYVRAEFKEITNHEYLRKTFYNSIYLPDGDGGRYELSEINIPMPPESLYKPYEALHQNWKSKRMRLDARKAGGLAALGDYSPTIPMPPRHVTDVSEFNW